MRSIILLVDSKAWFNTSDEKQDGEAHSASFLLSNEDGRENPGADAPGTGARGGRREGRRFCGFND